MTGLGYLMVTTMQVVTNHHLCQPSGYLARGTEHAKASHCLFAVLDIWDILVKSAALGEAGPLCVKAAAKRFGLMHAFYELGSENHKGGVNGVK